MFSHPVLNNDLHCSPVLVTQKVASYVGMRFRAQSLHRVHWFYAVVMGTLGLQALCVMNNIL